jgi:hypothetical protein
MEDYCQNPLCENEATKEVAVSVDKLSDETRALCAVCEEAYDWGVQHGLHNAAPGRYILPPPLEDNPPGSLWRAVYAIDVSAADAQQAAERAYQIMRDPQSLRPVLDVLDSKGDCTRVDLSQT